MADAPEFTIELGGESLRVPAELPVLPVRNIVVFPGTTAPLSVGRDRSVKSVRSASERGGLLVVMTQRRAEEEQPSRDDLYDTGVVVRILQMVSAAPGVSIVVLGLARVRILELLERDGGLFGRFELLRDLLDGTPEADVARRAVQRLGKELIQLRDDYPNELIEMLERIEDPARLSDLVAFGGTLSIEQKMQLLEQPDVLARLRVLMKYLTREVRVAQVSRGFAERAAGEIDAAQRKKLLREQLRKIQEELGDAEDQAAEEDQLRERIEEARLPEEARTVAEREVSRLGAMPQHSPERSVIRTYLEWILELPWQVATEDNLELLNARRILDEDHYDLERVKDRILEYLAVRHLVGDPKGPILCFVGPPGVGKTSLGKSIARAMGRKFARSSLGGVRDEAEIRGHRRTYVGALPGRILQALRQARARNPVFVLDEIDKIGMDYRGDPSSALLEVLDPEQNSTFSDHYLEIPFDLSKVLFVATANRTDTIPPPLLDRMEVIELPGYTAREKARIGREFLLPRQLEAHGVPAGQIEIGDDAILRTVEEYTREAGVRNLERQIAALVRKAALKLAEGEPVQKIDGPDLETYLGPPSWNREQAERPERPGIATGLVWTPMGGDITFVEAALLEGEPRLRLTGQLGDVMRESAEAANSYLRANAERLGIDPVLFEKNEIHVHFPAAALRKDGPSAGITILAALASVLLGRPLAEGLAMTGEITLRGLVLPVGGIKDKVIAAHRAGIRRVLLPRRNVKDLIEVPDEVREGLEFVFVDEASDVLREALSARV
jgi:ATP-dependent Lon protease